MHKHTQSLLDTWSRHLPQAEASKAPYVPPQLLATDLLNLTAEDSDSCHGDDELDNEGTLGPLGLTGQPSRSSSLGVHLRTTHNLLTHSRSGPWRHPGPPRSRALMDSAQELSANSSPPLDGGTPSKLAVAERWGPCCCSMWHQRVMKVQGLVILNPFGSHAVRILCVVFVLSLISSLWILLNTKNFICVSRRIVCCSFRVE